MPTFIRIGPGGYAAGPVTADHLLPGTTDRPLPPLGPNDYARWTGRDWQVVHLPPPTLPPRQP